MMKANAYVKVFRTTCKEDLQNAEYTSLLHSGLGSYTAHLICLNTRIN